MSTFTDTFDYSGADLAQNGWTIVNGDFTTDDSRLTPDSGPLQNDISRSQPRATGVFELNGVQNSASFYGLRIAFISQTRSFRGSSNPVGYTIQFRQERRGEVFFNIRGGPKDGQRLMTLDRNHGGDPHDIRIERDPDTYEFTVYYDGERVGSVVDDTYTESSYMAMRFDGGSRSQFVGGVSTGGESSPPTPVIDPAQVCPVQAVFETGLGDDDRLDLVTGKDTAVLVYPDGENLEQLSGEVTLRIPDSPDSALEPTSKTVSAAEFQRIASRNTYPEDPDCPCNVETDDGEISEENYIALYSTATGTGEKSVTVEIVPTDPQATVGGTEMGTTRSEPVTNRETESIDLVYYRLRLADTVGTLPNELPFVGPPLGSPAPPLGSPTIVPSVSEARELREQADAYVSAVYPVDECSSTVQGLTPAVSVPLFGRLADFAVLDFLSFVQTDGRRAVGVVSPDYFRYHGTRGRLDGMTTPPVPMTDQFLSKSILVTVNSPVTLAHELSHQYGLHTQTEEYDINGTDQTDGFWVDRREYINCRPSFMEGTPGPENRFNAWIDNKIETAGTEQTREDCDDDEFETDFADYDHLFRRLRPSGFLGLEASILGAGDAIAETAPKLKPPESAALRATHNQSPTPTSEIVYLKGIVSEDGTVFPLGWNYLQNRQLPPATEGSFTAVIRDATGSVLAERSFAVPFGLLVAASEPADVNLLDDYGYFSFPMEFPEGARTVEIQQDGSVIKSVELISKLLIDAVYSIPPSGFIGPTTEDVVKQHQTELVQISEKVRDALNTGTTRDAVQILGQDFRPALEQRLKDEYAVEDELRLTREEMFSLVADLKTRLNGEVSRADEYGSIFDPDSLTTGDVVTAKVSSQEDTSPDAKAGVMVRNDIEGSGDAGGYVICAVTPASGFSMEWDSDGTGYLDTTRRAEETTYPCWVRLRKDGTQFVGAYSTDGETWTEIASTTLPGANTTQDAGVFTTSGTVEATSEVEFEDFSVGPQS